MCKTPRSFFITLLSPRTAQEGDVLLSNHPQLAGGSHLPDITVITPVFNAGRVVFFVASRGHHADIGGISPGSMPPNSKLLVEEGAAVVSFKLVKNGAFQVGSFLCEGYSRLQVHLYWKLNIRAVRDSSSSRIRHSRWGVL
jgi:N-methylhydantoinase B/oxoprolinase/acetone carboxylase alpha subunit